MINPSLNALELHERYLKGKPFPHIAIDNFLIPQYADMIAKELEGISCRDWLFDPHSEQVNKWSMPDLSRLPNMTSSVLKFFNSPAALKFFEQLTGISPLIEDSTYLGGGVHLSSNGGRLGVHADFNLHPTTQKHRRLNALLYLNRDWDPSWNGQLEIWDEEMTKPLEEIYPTMNRLVVFNVTDKSFHGVPKTILCPPNVRRISLALYYYSDDRPSEEKGPFHWASWQFPRG
jgi:Rps23 Pro-64 3,4-dihydroxylase Tpa1-like proline 4-hydroxylase